jgi:uncharacterized protein YjbI with pentapeptide repeats
MPGRDEAPQKPPAPDLRSLRDEGAKLERHLDDGKRATARVVQRARILLGHAHDAGAAAWLYRDRDQIALAIARALRVLDAADEPIPKELREPLPFAGTPATFEAMDAKTALSRLRRSKAIVGRRLTGVRFADLEHARGAELIDCVLIDCDFTGLDLRGCTFLHCAFVGCELQGADLTDAVVTSCQITGRTTSRSPRLGGGGFGRITAVRTQFSASRFDNVTFTKTLDATDASFAYAQLVRCVAEPEACFARVGFDLAAIDEFNGSGANFQEARFVGAALMDAVLDGARMEGAVFSSARFAGASFLGARFTRDTTFKSAYFGGTDAMTRGVYQFDDGILDAALHPRDRAALKRALKISGR